MSKRSWDSTPVTPFIQSRAGLSRVLGQQGHALANQVRARACARRYKVLPAHTHLCYFMRPKVSLCPNRGRAL